jgi:hypothetical protein
MGKSKKEVDVNLTDYPQLWQVEPLVIVFIKGFFYSKTILAFFAKNWGKWLYLRVFSYINRIVHK